MTDRERAARALQLVGGPIELLIQRVAKEIGEAREEERDACIAVVEQKGLEHRSIAETLKRDGSHYAVTSHAQYERLLIGNGDSVVMRIRARGTESKTGGR